MGERKIPSSSDWDRFSNFKQSLRLSLYGLALALRSFGFNRKFESYPVYQQDGLVSIHNWDFVKDPASPRPTPIRRRARPSAPPSNGAPRAAFARHAMNLKAISWSAARTRASWPISSSISELRKSKKTFYLLDTFEGLEKNQISETESRIGRHAGGYAPALETVKKVFGKIKNVSIVQGLIPGSLKRVPTKSVAFIHIDMNLALPEIAAAEYFWPRMVAGGVMILDDYGHRPHFPQKTAFQKFAKRKGVEILSLPTGQGLLIKD
jgi:hypothetical protein